MIYPSDLEDGDVSCQWRSPMIVANNVYLLSNKFLLSIILLLINLISWNVYAYTYAPTMCSAMSNTLHSLSLIQDRIETIIYMVRVMFYQLCGLQHQGEE